MKRGIALTVEEFKRVSKLLKKYPSMSTSNIGKLASVSDASVYRIKHGECVVEGDKVIRKATLERRIEKKKEKEKANHELELEKLAKEENVKVAIEQTKELSNPPKVFTTISTDKRLETIIGQNKSIIEQNNQIITLLTTLVEVWK